MNEIINTIVKGGIDITITDVDSFKESVWGIVKRNVKGFGLSVRGQMSLSEPEGVSLDVQCDTPTSTNLQLQAVAGGNGGGSVIGGPSPITVSKMKAVQTIDTPGGALVVAPTYNLDDSKGDVSIAFARDSSSSIQVDVNTDMAAKVSLMQRIGSNNVIKPSITNDGQFELNYDTRVDYGTITTTYKPNHHVNIKWSDGPWQANFKIPMEGYYNMQDGVKISVKTKIDVNPNDFI